MSVPRLPRYPVPELASWELRDYRAEREHARETMPEPDAALVLALIFCRAAPGLPGGLRG